MIDLIIGAIVETIFGSLAESTGLGDWLRDKLKGEPTKQAFRIALSHTFNEVDQKFPGGNIQYFAEILRDIGGPMLARTLQPAEPFPTVIELTTFWLEHIDAKNTVHFRADFEHFAEAFLESLDKHMKNQSDLSWIVQTRLQSNSNKEIRRIADSAQYSADLQADSHQLLEKLFSLATELAQRPNIVNLVITNPIPPKDMLPSSPPNYVMRETLISNLQAQLSTVSWIAFVDGPGKGKTLLARDLMIASKLQYKWISLRGQGTLNPLDHFRQQLICWLIDLDSNNNHWRSYLNGQLDSYEVSRQILNIVLDRAILVIDELPIPASFNAVYDEIGNIAQAFAQAGSKIITTSQHPLPPSFQAKHRVYITDIARFEYDDIVAMLKFSNAPDYIMTPGFIGLLMTEKITGGLPSLLIVTIEWLIRNNWKFSGTDWDAFFHGEPADAERKFGRGRILNLLEDTSKQLLYRLSLLSESFDQSLALRIASISPPLPFPAEAFEKLTSPWLEKLGVDVYQLSPYLSSTGRNNLDILVQQKIHETAADYYLAEGVINVNQIVSISSHLYAAAKYEEFAAFLIYFMVQGISDPEQAQDAEKFRFVTHMFISTPWPETLDLKFRIMFRAAQIRVCMMAGKEITKLNTDLAQLLASTTTKEWPAVLFAHGTISFSSSSVVNNDIYGQLRFEHAMQFYRYFRDLMESPTKIAANETTLNGTSLSEFISQVPVQIEEIIWLGAAALSNREQLRLFLNEVRQMTIAEREKLFTFDKSISFLAHFCDNVWIKESQKPIEMQDWNTVLAFLDEIQDVGALPGAFPFRVMQACAKAIVLTDYLQASSDIALKELYDLPTLDNASLLFHVNYSIGNCLFFEGKQDSVALRHLELAISTKCNDFPRLYLESFQYVAVLQSKLGNWAAAKKSCSEAIRLAVKLPDIATYKRIEMQGELAWIYWSLGDKRKACQAMYGNIMGLLQCFYNPGNKHFREAFNKAGHALGWFVSMTGSGTPPAATHTGDPYADIFPGFFAIHRPQTSEWTSPIGFSKTVILHQLACFAEHVGLSRMAWKLYLLRDSVPNDCPNPFITKMGDATIYELAAIYGTPEQIILYGVRSVSSMIMTRGLLNNAVDIYNTDITVDNCINSVDFITRKNLEHELLQGSFVPFYLNMINQNYPRERIENHLAELQNLLEENRLMFYEPDFWFETIRFFQLSTKIWFEKTLIPAEHLIIPQDHPFLQLLLYLVSSTVDNSSSLNSLNLQFACVNYLLSYPRQSKNMWRGVGEFLHHYWQKYPGFRLRNPSRFQEELNKISPTQREKTATNVLLRASEAVGAGVSQEDFQKFQTIAEKRFVLIN